MACLLKLFYSRANADNLDIGDFVDLAPHDVDEAIIDDDGAIIADEVDDDIVADDIDIDDFVSIDASKDAIALPNGKSHVATFAAFGKTAGIAFLKVMVGGAKTLKDIADLIYNIGYTTYCVTYTSIKLVIVVSEIVLTSGKILYFMVKTTVQTTSMCYRMLMQELPK
ncbi:hypothetical protein F-E9_509 [Faustovirus]|nr:hypothetical protein F-VV57_0487 [Faustovirus]QJX73755.1 hypothetical protein F-VV63_0489 [Faustovirus]QJX74262.1 hypothetical protein F-E9_509 [Faustovirus]SMH63471.1 Hypothetical protein FSTVLC9_436 [Faustovirus]